MKLNKKISAVLVMIIAILVMANTSFAGTWQADGAGWWYQNDDGSYPVGSWQLIDGSWYHFNGSGYMQTGWVADGGYWYYMDPSGQMHTGWLADGGYWYYFNFSGTMATGVQVIDGITYTFASSGEWLGEAGGYDFKTFNWGDSVQTVINYEGEPEEEGYDDANEYYLAYYGYYSTDYGVIFGPLFYFFNDYGLSYAGYYFGDGESYSQRESEFNAIFDSLYWEYGDPVIYETDFVDVNGDYQYEYAIFMTDTTGIALSFGLDSVILLYRMQ